MFKVILYFACTLVLILVGLILVLLKLEAIGGSMIAAGLLSFSSSSAPKKNEDNHQHQKQNLR